MPEIIYDKILMDRPHLKAIRFDFAGNKIWIPRSQIKNHDLMKQTVDIPQWLIEADGLEPYTMED
ncbi:MAG: hypothetical protein V1751_08355 [Pseudomonadota bacterium]